MQEKAWKGRLKLLIIQRTYKALGAKSGQSWEKCSGVSKFKRAHTGHEMKMGTLVVGVVNILWIIGILSEASKAAFHQKIHHRIAQVVK